MPGTFVSVLSSTTRNAVPDEDWRRCEDVRGGMYGRISDCREVEAAIVTGGAGRGLISRYAAVIRIRKVSRAVLCCAMQLPRSDRT